MPPETTRMPRRGAAQAATAHAVPRRPPSAAAAPLPPLCLPAGLVAPNATRADLTPRDYGQLAQAACITPLEQYPQVGGAQGALGALR